MSREISDPVVTVKDGPGGPESTTTHPAFAQIGASRVSGNTYLYGSDFNHGHYVTISIRTSEEHRTNSRDWHFGRQELIEVALSEAQWATFVSSMNVGAGVPCTLERHNGQMIPGLPKPKPVDDKFKQDLQETMKEIQDDLLRISQELTKPLGVKAVVALRRDLDLARGRLTGSTGWVARQFSEHVESTVEQAKIEVNAYVTAQVQRAGLEALGATGPLLLENKK